MQSGRSCGAGVPPYLFGNSDDGLVAFRLHLWERVAVETGGALGNGDARAEWPAAGGTESPRVKRSNRTALLDGLCDA